MVLKTHRMRWWTMFCLHLAPLFMPAANAQVNYLSIFGNAGCSKNYRLSANVAPSSLSFIANPDINDPTTYGPGVENVTNYYQNSIYDRAGNLLFSVNANGIYGNSGERIYNFGGVITTNVTPGCYEPTIIPTEFTADPPSLP